MLTTDSALNLLKFFLKVYAEFFIRKKDVKLIANKVSRPRKVNERTND